MEFAAVNSPKSTAKTVAITLTNEEANNPANAFAALLNLGPTRFKAEHGLGKIDSQWIRAPKPNDAEAAPKPKEELAAKPKDKADARDDSSVDDDQEVVAVRTSDDTEDASSKEPQVTSATTETQPAEQTAAVGVEALQTISIQFQILVQLPDGNLQDMGTFDLKSLLAAASQDAGLASALEAAFGQAADSLAAGQSLLNAVNQNVSGELAQNLGPDTSSTINAQQAGSAPNSGVENNTVSQLFKQIAAAFHPLAQQADAIAANTQATQSTQTAGTPTGDVAQIDLDLLTPDAVRQSQELSKILGSDSKIRIQVAVNGQKVADLPFDSNPFNRFVGYNPEVTRAAATAASAQPGNPLIDGAQPQVAVLSGNTAQQANVGAQLVAGGGIARSDVAPVRAPELAAPTPSSSTNSQSPSNTFATALGQTTGNTAPAQTSAAERPLPAQPQQIIDQIKVNITRAAKAGLDRVTILLRPVELGRIDIKLEMTDEGNVRASITADRPATLELLQREVRGLERALQDAGLQTDTDNLEFNLRSDTNDRLAEDAKDQNRRAPQSAENDPKLSADNENIEDFDYTAAARIRGGIDTYA